MRAKLTPSLETIRLAKVLLEDGITTRQAHIIAFFEDTKSHLNPNKLGSITNSGLPCLTDGINKPTAARNSVKWTSGVKTAVHVPRYPYGIDEFKKLRFLASAPLTLSRNNSAAASRKY